MTHTASITTHQVLDKLYEDGIITELKLISVLGKARHNLDLNRLEISLVNHNIVSAERLADIKRHISGRPVYLPGQVEISTQLDPTIARRHGVLLTEETPGGRPLLLMVEDTPTNVEAIKTIAPNVIFEIGLITVPHFKEMYGAAYEGREYDSHPEAADLFDVLDATIDLDATDLHLAVGVPPRVRADGGLKFLDFKPTTLAWLNDQVDALVEDRHRRDLEDKFSTDLAYSYGTARFRINIGTDNVGPTMALRLLPSKIPTPAEINLPNSVRNFAQLERGLVLITGPTGSGKLVKLSTTIPTPSGSTTMGQIEVGDEVLGRDGRPCTVTSLSEVDHTPDLYRIHFSDGQEIVADIDHQWLVADHHHRNVVRTKKRLRALSAKEKGLEDAQALEALAEVTPADALLTSDELFELLTVNELTTEFVAPTSVWSSLHLNDLYGTPGHRFHHVVKHTTRTQKATFYPTRPILEYLAGTKWVCATKAAELLKSGDYPDETTCQKAGELLGTGRHLQPSRAVKALGLQGRKGEFESSYTVEANHKVPVKEFPVATALELLARRIRQRYWGRPGSEAQLVRMTTGEMLAKGLRNKSNGAQFATPVPEPLQLPEAGLPVDPYVLGAWLGDGSSNGGGMTGVDDQIWMHFETAGYKMRHHAVAKSHHALGLVKDLRKVGVLKNKHIPTAYLRASYEQRLAVLQGLMDTDGTIDVNGSCELSLSDKTLATGALELIRSLGIKASASWDRPASYRDNDTGELVECKDRHRIHFTTTTPVFRLPRKLERIPETVRETQKWNHIVDITPITPDDPDYGPARCLSVDNDDHTYLCGDGFVVTSNSTSLAAVLYEIIAESGRHVITLEDPIEFSFPRHMSAQVNQRELGSSLGSFPDGIRDALRQDPDVVLVGELRDAETIGAALTLAETGHLVFGTLHTYDAPSTVMRMVNSFPAAEQDAVRAQLSQLLRGVVSQTLVPRASGKGRVAAFELMLNTPAIATNLRKLDGHNQLKATMQTGAADGMQTMEMALAKLVHTGVISDKEGRFRARDETEYQRNLDFLKRQPSS